MTRKRFNKLRLALCTKVGEYAKENGQKLSGKTLRDMPKPKTRSYSEAWEMLQPIRDLYPEIGRKSS